MKNNVLMVVDMQNGVFTLPRYNRQGTATLINQLIAAADQVIFVQHKEADMQPGSSLFDIIAELHLPSQAHYVTKTACDAFWNTGLEVVLETLHSHSFTVCGCATDYCVDTTIKVGASKGYAITVASDAHTTANRTYATAPQLIGQHNQVWAELSMPGNAVVVKPTQAILDEWQQ